jgi:ribosomal protein S18 acetylase RimI-like enzyme
MPPASMPFFSTHMASPAITFRDTPLPTDPAAIREIVASTGFFHDHEIAVAVELIDERLARGLASEYHFLFAEEVPPGSVGQASRLPAGQRPAPHVFGYACFGPIACTQGSFDLYWIAVHDSQRGRGLGRALLAETERRIAAGAPSADSPCATGGLSGEAAPARASLIRGRRIYIETSSQPKYEPTRAFYLKCGYREEARFEGFYAEGDDKVVYVKRLSS